MPVNNLSAVNLTRVLREVFLNPGVSRVEIARALGLNKSTVSNIVTLLCNVGIVRAGDQGAAGPSGGRRPVQLSVNAAWGTVLGVSLQPEGFSVVGLNVAGERVFTAGDTLDFSAVGITEACADIVRRYRAEIEAVGGPMIGVGIGLPGFVDPIAGVLYASMPLESYQPIDFVAEVQARVGRNVPVLIDNDANCGCWAELIVPQAMRRTNFAFMLGEVRRISVSRAERVLAIGFGLMLGGRVHYGNNFAAGEFHSVVGPPKGLSQLNLDPDDLPRLFHDHVVDQRVADELAAHLALLSNILGLDAIVIGGELAALTDRIAPRVAWHIEAAWKYPQRAPCEVSAAGMGALSVAYGAAAMFLERLITTPGIDEPGAARQGIGLALLAREAVERSAPV